MPGLLTTASVMTCPHGGMVQAMPSSTSVQIGGAPALAASDTFMIAGCTFNISGVPSPCVTVQWVQPAEQSTRSGSPTLTEASIGLCLAATQAPQGPVIISSAQPNVTGQ
jgi:hypothetical protein